MTLRDTFLQRIDGSLAAVASLKNQVGTLERIADVVIDCLKRGNRVYTAGNGGSAAHALHLAEELIGRFRSNRQALPAVCLNADVTALTCIANDFGYEHIFSRQCEALLRPDDLLIVFSTSGSSRNLLKALTAARQLNATTMGVLGRAGGECRAFCDHAIIVESADNAHIQEAHQVVLHLICEAVEEAFPKS